MSHASHIQKARARRGRRRNRRIPMHPMEAYNPRCRTAKWITRAAWTRKHPVRRKFRWGHLWQTKAPKKKWTGERWWEDYEERED